MEWLDEIVDINTSDYQIENDEVNEKLDKINTELKKNLSTFLEDARSKEQETLELSKKDFYA